MSKFSNRALLGEALNSFGIPKLASRFSGESNLLVLNYHRIGDYQRTLGDPDVFSATASEFERQISFLIRECNLLTPADLGLIRSGKNRTKNGIPNVLLTFDDGYRDSFETIFPILKSQGAYGIFFLPTGLIGTEEVSWWDKIRAILNSAKRTSFVLRFPIHLKCDIAQDGIESVSRAIISAYKSKEMNNPERFISELVKECGGSVPSKLSDSSFMRPEDALTMFREGMTIGVHSHSHRILARLSDEDERCELVKSTETMRCLLGEDPKYFSYPVGSKDSFSDRTSGQLKQLGYEFAFSFYGGVNNISNIDQWNVKRCGVNHQSLNHFRTKVFNASAFGAYFP
jgi:peptidoglycan/xylan/chitin deacetylase (PgdA/CDA1 family)